MDDEELKNPGHRFKEGNQHGRRNWSELRYKLYRKQKNLFTAIDNRLQRRLGKIKFTNYYYARRRGPMNRMVKLLVLNMDRDGWVRKVQPMYRYYSKQSGDFKSYTDKFLNCNFNRFYQILKKNKIIIAKKAFVDLHNPKKKKYIAFEMNPEFIKDLDLPEKYLYTGSTYMYDKGILDTHLQYNEFIKTKQREEESIKS